MQPTEEQNIPDDFVRINGGSFRMGSPEAGPGSRTVKLDAFYLGKTEVTTSQYAAFLNDTRTMPGGSANQFHCDMDKYFPCRGLDAFPVSGVTRAEAEAYASWLGLRYGMPGRLPTEEEWEFAARAGLHGARFPWGWGAPEGRACFGKESACPVASYPPNDFGLFDLAGNLFEWCAGMPGDDGTPAWARGGSWAERDPDLLRVFHRVAFSPDYRGDDMGFRVVLVPER